MSYVAAPEGRYFSAEDVEFIRKLRLAFERTNTNECGHSGR